MPRVLNELVPKYDFLGMTWNKACVYNCVCVCVCVCVLYVCFDKRLIDCVHLQTKVRVSFIVLATLWGPKPKH